MSKRSFAALLIPGAVLALFFHFMLVEVYGSALTDRVFELLEHVLDVPKARMMATITPYLLPVTGSALAIYAAFRVGEYERRSYEPVADIDPRIVFEKILENEKWLSKFTEHDAEKVQHLVPNYLEMRLDKQIHDALAQGRLWSWGEKSLPGLTDGPLDKISADKWHEMEIVFGSYSEGTRAFSHTRVGGKLAYLGIKLNKRQVAKEFSISMRALL